MSEQQHLNSLEDLEALIQKSGILQRFSIRRLGVFGSFALHDQANDIDLLIEDDISLEDAMRFKEEFAAMVDNRLDIILKRLANPIVMYRAKKGYALCCGINIMTFCTCFPLRQTGKRSRVSETASSMTTLAWIC